MAERQYYLLENYNRIRYRLSRIGIGKSKIDSALELCRIIFLLAEETGLKEPIDGIINDILKNTYQEIGLMPAISLERSIINYFYEVTSEHDGSASVRLMLFEDTALVIGEHDLCTFLKYCDDIIMQFAKADNSNSNTSENRHSQSSTPGAKKRCDKKELGHNDGYQKYRKEIQIINEAHIKYWKANKRKIVQERMNRSDGDALNCVLTYQNLHEDKIMYRMFHDKQQALLWVHNKNNVRKRSFFRIFNFPNIEETRILMAKDLAVINVELINPFTGGIISKCNASFDTGADIASFPFDRKVTESLMSSVTVLNDEVVPTVYAKLRINDHTLETIYEIEMEMDKEWCAIGIPQMVELDRFMVKQIMKHVTNMLKK